VQRGWVNYYILNTFRVRHTKKSWAEKEQENGSPPESSTAVIRKIALFNYGPRLGKQEERTSEREERKTFPEVAANLWRASRARGGKFKKRIAEQKGKPRALY